MTHEKKFISIPTLAILIVIGLSTIMTAIYFPGYLSSTAEAAESAKAIESTLLGEGKASFYAGDFHGQTTANGEKFNMNKLTAAHPSLPFGTWVRVTNLRNGRDVVVRINDRGPFIKGRIIDLSVGAAKALDIMKTGTTRVKIETLDARQSPSSAG
ncbi:MAG: septal ring lytic transglycosylase RlpA family protein [Chlorobiaceae bacterium]